MKIKSVIVRAEFGEQPTAECVIYYDNNCRVSFQCDPLVTLDTALKMAESACPLEIKSTIN